MKLQPLDDRIVVRANESEATTASGLVTERNRPRRAAPGGLALGSCDC